MTAITTQRVLSTHRDDEGAQRALERHEKGDPLGVYAIKPVPKRNRLAVVKVKEIER